VAEDKTRFGLRRKFPRPRRVASSSWRSRRLPFLSPPILPLEKSEALLSYWSKVLILRMQCPRRPPFTTFWVLDPMRPKVQAFVFPARCVLFLAICLLADIKKAYRKKVRALTFYIGCSR
jgi:hypothetical protein